MRDYIINKYRAYLEGMKCAYELELNTLLEAENVTGSAVIVELDRRFDMLVEIQGRLEMLSHIEEGY